MPLIRVSDQVHEHLKQLGQDGQLSVDAVLKQALNIDGAQTARTYVARADLMPLEIYRWFILSAIPHWNAYASRAMLQEHVGNTLVHYGLNEVFPNDWTSTPNARLRWKVRFSNIFGEMVKYNILQAQFAGTVDFHAETYYPKEDVWRNFLRLGLHVDTVNEDWWFTKLPEVEMRDWWACHPLTIDGDEHHPPLMAGDEDYLEWLDKVYFIWGGHKHSSLKLLANLDQPNGWDNVHIGEGLFATVTNSGIKLPTDMRNALAHPSSPSSSH